MHNQTPRHVGTKHIKKQGAINFKVKHWDYTTVTVTWDIMKHHYNGRIASTWTIIYKDKAHRYNQAMVDNLRPNWGQQPIPDVQHN